MTEADIENMDFQTRTVEAYRLIMEFALERSARYRKQPPAENYRRGYCKRYLNCGYYFKDGVFSDVYSQTCILIDLYDGIRAMAYDPSWRTERLIIQSLISDMLTLLWWEASKDSGYQGDRQTFANIMNYIMHDP